MLIEKTLSILDEIESKNVDKEEKVIDRGKRNKTLSEVMALKNINYKTMHMSNRIVLIKGR